MKNKYATPDNFYNDWQTPPGKTKKTHVACHLALIEDFKKRHDNLINISRKKALTKHENVVVKAFFCGERCGSPKFIAGAGAKRSEARSQILRLASERPCKSEKGWATTLSHPFDTRRNETKFAHLSSDPKGGKLTCPQSKERLDAGFKVEKSVHQDESALPQDRVRGVYIYGVRQPRNK